MWILGKKKLMRYQIYKDEVYPDNWINRTNKLKCDILILRNMLKQVRSKIEPKFKQLLKVVKNLPK